MKIYATPANECVSSCMNSWNFFFLISFSWNGEIGDTNHYSGGGDLKSIC